MKLAGDQKIRAPREAVYAALNDEDILKQSIPGCQSLTKVSDTEMEAEVGLKVGPVKATFKGAVTLSNLNPPESYTIAGEGKGGAAGHARGGADVVLRADGDDTILAYDVDVQIGGKIAQLGARLIDSTAKKLSAQFFTRFGELVEGQQEPEAAPASAQEEEADKPGLWGRIKQSVGAGQG